VVNNSVSDAAFFLGIWQLCGVPLQSVVAVTTLPFVAHFLVLLLQGSLALAFVPEGVVQLSAIGGAVAFGWTLGDMEDLGTQIVVTGITTRFLAPGVEGDELIVETWVEEIRRVTATFGQRIIRDGASPDVLATQTVTAACTTSAGRPTRFPADLLAGMEPYLARER